jgi:hypothetical protein
MHSDYDHILPFFQRLELRTERMIWIDKIGLQRDAEWAVMIGRCGCGKRMVDQAGFCRVIGDRVGRVVIWW